MLIYILILLTGIIGQKNGPSEEIQKNYALYERWVNADLDSSWHYASLAHQLASTNQNTEYLDKTTYALGYLLYMREEDDEAKKMLLDAITLSEQSANTSILISAHYRIGKIHSFAGAEDSALQHLLIAGDLLKSSKLSYHADEGNLYEKLGHISWQKEDSIGTTSYFHRAMRCFEVSKDTLGLIRTNNDLGVFFLSCNDLPSARHAFEECLDLATRASIVSSKARASLNLATVYLNEEEESKYGDALNLLQYCETVWGNNIGSRNRLNLYRILSAYYRKAEMDNARSIHYKLRAVDLAKKLNEKELLHDLYHNLIENYHEMGDYAEAHKYYNRYIELNEELHDLNKIRDMEEIQTKYEVDLKDQQIQLLDTEKEAQRTQKRAILLISLLLMGLLATALWSSKERRKRMQLLNEQERKDMQHQAEMEQIKAEIRGQEEERSRLARELHDQIGGQLAALRLKLSGEGGSNPNIAQSVDQLGEVCAELRQVSHALSSTPIHQNDLKALLGRLIQSYGEHLQVELSIFPRGWTGPEEIEVKTSLYRIAQELMANVAKHGDTAEVTIQLVHQADEIRLLVSDEGKGFDPQQADEGLGLHHIRERLAAHKGELHIDSTPGSGSTFIAILPYE